MRVKEQQLKDMEQATEMLKQKVTVMTESNQKKIREIERVDKTDPNSISSLDNAIAKLTESGKLLERETEGLRERLAEFVGSSYVRTAPSSRSNGPYVIGEHRSSGKP